MNNLKNINDELVVNEQRIDSWLFRSRIIKSRAKAQRLSAKEAVKLYKEIKIVWGIKINDKIFKKTI